MLSPRLVKDIYKDNYWRICILMGAEKHANSNYLNICNPSSPPSGLYKQYWSYIFKGLLLPPIDSTQYADKSKD